jgi:photosystem II stability/assembly factor-like uncharacterized protein
MKKIHLFIILCLVLPDLSYSQAWLDHVETKKSMAGPGFYELQKAFNEYWKDRVPGSGSGYKPFRRWEWFMEPRVDSLGRYPVNLLWEATQKRLSIGTDSKGSTADWKYIGPDSIPFIYRTPYLGGMGRIDCIAFHPTDTNIIYIGAPTGGVWKTMDAGKTWNSLTDFLPSIGIADIVLHPESPETLFIATGDRDGFDLDGIGVLKSTDGGLSWQSAGLIFQLHDQVVVNKLLIDPIHPDIMLAATSNGIYKTTNGGISWDRKLAGHYKDIEYKADNPSMVLAAEFRSGGSRIYRSTDGGTTFSEITQFTTLSASKARRIELAVSPLYPDYVVALASDADGGLLALYRSTNFGSFWSVMFAGTTRNLLVTDPNGNGTGGQGWYDLCLTMAPTSVDELYVGGINIWKGTEAGSTWTLKSFGYPYWNVTTAPYVHVDHHALEFQPVTGALYSGNDGGIYVSYDRGNHWKDLSNTLNNLQIYRLGSSSVNLNMVITGNQDNGTFLSREGRWAKILIADGMECIVDYTDTNILYSTTQYGNIYKSFNGARSWYNIKPDHAADGAWITPYVIHPTEHNILYAGYEDVYMSMDGGESWIKRSNFNLTGNARVNVLAISPSHPHVLYASSGTFLWKTTDGGEMWIRNNGSLPSFTISGITVSPYDPNKVFLTFSGYARGIKVFRSLDGGLTWENYSSNLPNVPVNCIIYENNSNQGLYIGTDIGVFYRNRGMTEWVSYNDHLPNVIVNELEIQYEAGKIRAGTYGRGLWESSLYLDDTHPLVPEFAVNRTSSCVGSPFVFYNKSSADCDSILWEFGNAASPSTSRKDTVQVVYSSGGNKDVKITVYRDGLSAEEAKVDVVESMESIEVTTYPDTVNIPPGDTIMIRAMGADTYTWQPADFLDTVLGNEVHASPDHSITYTVTGIQGICTDQASSVVNILENDHVCHPTPLSVGVNGTFSNQNATVEMNEPMPDTLGADACTAAMKWCPEGGLQHTVWFSFTGPSSGVISLDSRGFDNQIAIYDANQCSDILAGNFTLLAANDDYYAASQNYAAAIKELRNLTPGRTYYVQVDGSAGGQEGNFTLTLATSPLDVEMPDRQTMHLFKLYPNPGSGQFTIEFSQGIARKVRLQVMNIAGQVVWNDTEPYAHEGQRLTLDLSRVPSGIYLLEAVTEKSTEKVKLVVERKL